MRQISLRQEAGRVGGIGSCGRELCCTTWLTDFKSVSTSAARYQNLSLNPLKLSGQCGRLKCCLNYELDTYLEELKDIPKVERPIKTEDGDAFLQKTDIFKKLMWFGYKGDTNWHVVPVTRVVELLELNEKGIIPHSLQLDETEEVEEVAVNHDLLQLDKKYRSKDKSSSSKRKGRGNNKKKPNNQRKVEAKKPGKKTGNAPSPKAKNNSNKPKERRDDKNKKGLKPNAQSQQNGKPKAKVQQNSQQKAKRTEEQSSNVRNRKPNKPKNTQQQKNRPNPNNKGKEGENIPKRPQRNKVKLQRQGVVENKSNQKKERSSNESKNNEK